MHVLVAGGAGFIGSHLCDRLLAKGHRVLCVDNLKTGRRANLRQAAADPRFTLIRADVRRALRLPKTDFVFHLASYASPPYYQTWSVDTMLTNAVGTHRLLEHARRHGAGFLLASTSEVYGDPLTHPQREGDWGNVNPVGVRACYDEAKRFAEALTMEYVRKHGLDARIARIFNTYGPRLQKDDGRVISNFIHQALAGRPLTLYGTGRQTRSFCYVSDMVEGLLRVAFRRGKRGEIVSLGKSREVSMQEAARLVCRLCGRPLRTVHRPLPGDDPQRRRPDIRRVRRELGWEPRVSLETGLARTIAWFRDDTAAT